MATYLLLRNNRETGPLTKEQILALGLKPYDLIWVEGRSAAWRYANEIPDLKDYAPTVEEQPYDRFYKKNTPDPVKEFVENTVKRHAEEPVNKQIAIAVTEGIVQEYINELKRENGSASNQQQVKENAQEDLEDLLKKYGSQQTVEKGHINDNENNREDVEEFQEESTGRSVNEVLGRQLTKGGNGSVSVIMPTQRSVAKEEKTFVKKVSVTERQEVPVIKKVPVPIPAAETGDEPVNMQTKYSTPLDEIKERYVKQLSERKQASAQRKFVMKTVKRAAIFIAIIGAGVLIGFAIKPGSNKGQLAQNSLQAVPLVNNSEPAAVKVDTVLNNETNPETAPSTIKDYREGGQADKKEAVKQPAVQVDEKKFLENATNSPSMIEAANGERNKNIRTANTETEVVEKRNVVVGDLSNQVSVKANNYKERDLGGFRNLQLTVTNESNVALESVMVELTYKKYNDDILSTKHIHFEAIPAGEALTVKVPDNNRGSKLSYRIIQIDPRNN